MSNRTRRRSQRPRFPRALGGSVIDKLADTLCDQILLESRGSGDTESLIWAWRARDLVALCDWVPPYDALSIRGAMLCRQLQALFQKRVDLDLGFDRRARCLDKFMESERLCKSTNALFRMWERGGVSFPPRVCAVLFRASQKISHILGDVPSVDELIPRFGPGATTCTTKKNSHPLFKLEAGLACSGSTATSVFVDRFSDMFPAWARALAGDTLETYDTINCRVTAGRVSTVAKKYDTDRDVVPEAPYSVFWELAYGDWLIKRLGCHGIDLTDQTRNQRAARRGSLTGALATLDLRMASNTLAAYWVLSMLPPEWGDVLSRLRHTDVDVDGRHVRLEKFASTGNGFTFPLESLLFFALCWASSEYINPDFIQDVSVYGDDLIVRREVYPLLTEVLHTCGLVVNSDKSYASGPFRESCGSDYVRGIDIRPVYLRDKLNRETLFVLHNGLFRRGLFDLAAIVLDGIPIRDRVFGPDSFGDGHLLGGEWSSQREDADKGWERWSFKTYVSVPRRQTLAHVPPDLMYAYALLKGQKAKALPDLTLRRYNRAIHEAHPLPNLDADASSSEGYSARWDRGKRSWEFWVACPSERARYRIQKIYTPFDPSVS